MLQTPYQTHYQLQRLPPLLTFSREDCSSENNWINTSDYTVSESPSDI